MAPVVHFLVQQTLNLCKAYEGFKFLSIEPLALWLLCFPWFKIHTFHLWDKLCSKLNNIGPVLYLGDFNSEVTDIFPSSSSQLTRYYLPLSSKRLSPYALPCSQTSQVLP